MFAAETEFPMGTANAIGRGGCQPWSTMFRIVRTLLVAVALVSASALGVVRETETASAQGACSPGNSSPSIPCDIGSVDGRGVAVFDRLGVSGGMRAFRFGVGPFPTAAHIYLGDQWMNLDMTLWRDGAPGIASPTVCSQSAGCLGESRSSARGVVQFLEPDVIVAQQLQPSSAYTVVVFPGKDFGQDPYHPYDTFTLHLALTSPVCGVVKQDGGTYHVAVVAEPPDPRTSSLLTFTAIVTPPYTDLFDFDWEINGQSVETATTPVIQRPASALGVGRHQVRVVARGVRNYPDPDQPQVPPTLTATCQLPIS
jgi:hypothetical protein